LVFQTFNRGPQRLDIELCDHRTWETNDQCPRFAVENGFDLDGPFRPQPEVNEHMGIDRRARIDAYASTRKAYPFLHGQPHASPPRGTLVAAPPCRRARCPPGRSRSPSVPSSTTPESTYPTPTFASFRSTCAWKRAATLTRLALSAASPLRPGTNPASLVPRT